MNQERERAAFEAWATTESSPVLEIGRFAWDDNVPPNRDIGEYREPSTERAWEVWQAASTARATERGGEAVAWAVMNNKGFVNSFQPREDDAKRIAASLDQASLYAPFRVVPLYTTEEGAPSKRDLMDTVMACMAAALDLPAPVIGEPDADFEAKTSAIEAAVNALGGVQKCSDVIRRAMATPTPAVEALGAYEECARVCLSLRRTGPGGQSSSVQEARRVHNEAVARCALACRSLASSANAGKEA